MALASPPQTLVACAGLALDPAARELGFRATVDIQSRLAGATSYSLRVFEQGLEGSRLHWETTLGFASRLSLDVLHLKPDTVYRVEVSVASPAAPLERVGTFVRVPPAVTVQQATAASAVQQAAIASTPARAVERPEPAATATTVAAAKEPAKEKAAPLEPECGEVDELEAVLEAVALGFCVLASGAANSLTRVSATLSSTWERVSDSVGWGRVSGMVNWIVWDSWRWRDEGIHFDVETDTFYFECPHCQQLCEVPRSEIRCTIFRHATFKDGLRFVPPHASKEECDRWVAQGKVYGCGKPFRFDGYTVEKCDYI